MKAILFHTHGGPEVLEYADFAEPKPRPGEVLVRLRAAALNRVDLFVRNGWPGLKLEYPHIPGADGAGDVAALGEGAIGFQVGDRVVINANLGCGECDNCRKGQDNLCRDWHLLGETCRGTYCEMVSLPARQLHKIPAGFEYHKATAAALVYQTAWHSMVKRGGVQAGETVVIVGAGGGVNSASIQIAKYLGARVIVVGSNSQKLSQAEAIGADILIDRSKDENWSKTVFRATEKLGADVVVDNVGTTFPLSLRVLKKGGRLLTVGNSGAPKFEIDNRFIFARHLSILGSTMSTIADFREVMDLVFRGALSPILDRTYPLHEAALAHERLWRGENFGKITIDIP
ncbi:MAG TPA: zinc-binding dehydrogenase [Anaerolineales bacterium]|nr:zinc-binding dehydrogenase [Anaerolineales bacterium]HNO30278.1 zinc-binding dehydrogenase [Anaerolineales bacterium]